MVDEQDLELNQASHFMKYITGGSFRLLERPDLERPSRKGGHPDFRFGDEAGNEYVLELTRLLTRKLRNLEKFVKDNISARVEGKLPGKYGLKVSVDQIGRGWITPKVAAEIVAEVLALAQSGTLRQTQQLRAGYVLSKVGEDGSSLVPLIIGPLLPPDLTLTDPLARELEREFQKIVHEADQKFQGYSRRRVVLIGLSQSGLYWGFHAKTHKDGQGVMLTWADNEGRKLVNTDYVYLEPGFGVWQEDGKEVPQKVFTGHIHVDTKAGYYILLWQRPGTPRLPGVVSFE